jgi:hypothetical protein
MAQSDVEDLENAIVTLQDTISRMQKVRFVMASMAAGQSSAIEVFSAELATKQKQLAMLQKM